MGDGAFQMTGTELATLVDQKLRPIVLLLNNGGYGMLEAIDGPRPYYDRRDWDYPALARALGAEAERVTRPSQSSRRHSQRAEASSGAYLIEAITARDDLSPVMTRIRNHIKSAWACSAGSLIVERQNGSETSIQPRVVGNVLDGDHGLDLPAADFGQGIFPERIQVAVAEDMMRRRRAAAATTRRPARVSSWPGPQPEWPT